MARSSPRACWNWAAIPPLVLLRAPNAAEALAAGGGHSGLPHVGALVLECRGNPKCLDLVASRRLAFAAAESGVTAHPAARRRGEMPSAALTRWQVPSAPSRRSDDDWGNPRFRRRSSSAIGWADRTAGPCNGIPTMDFSANTRARDTRRILALWLPRLPTDRLMRKARVAV